MEWLDTIIDEVKDRAPLLLAGMAIAGFGFTVYETAKGAVEAEKVKENLPEDAETIDVVKAVAPCYGKAAAAGGFTVGCIIFGAAVGYEQKIELLVGYAALDRFIHQYSGKVKEVIGEGKEQDVRKDIAKEDALAHMHPIPEEDEILFYDENYVDDETGIKGKYFTDTLEHVHDVEYHYNRNLALRDYAEWNEFYELLDNEEMPPTKDGAHRGYSLYTGETEYGYRWVDFEHELVELDDGLKCMIIHTPFAPHMDYLWA